MGFCIFLCLAASSQGQILATLKDLGTTAPVPGTNDAFQLSATGNQTYPDMLDYYTDNQVTAGSGEPGQTFVTGTAAGVTGWSLFP
jgi:hypothetical protein